MSTASRFQKLNDDAPRIPSYTCDYINRAQRASGDLRDQLENFAKKLEELRKLNEQLRAGYWYWRCAASDLCSTVEKLQSKQQNGHVAQVTTVAAPLQDWDWGVVLDDHVPF